eukprot:TRINITY_DN73975_c0_g1_i1.p1 TRINITY_DN73975_c0_g1~~TRINITY_DN73975_c0_g1_i1.p1  ORF type:complete len:325 (+),score=49.03 TRINITY_DN73975_c0_g1_i1:125-1099(+)
MPSAADLALTARTCSSAGEMIWTRDNAGLDKFTLCYAPAKAEFPPGPSTGHIECDPGSKFTVDAPQICCANPRMQNDFTEGKKVKASGEVCGDMMMDFDPVSQKARFVRGPSLSGTNEQLSDLLKSGLGGDTPSPVAIKAYQDGKEWNMLDKMICNGRRGTIVKFVGEERAEFCPTGTFPVRGDEYASWMCDASYTKEKAYHCCSVLGKTRCVNKLVDKSAADSCRCQAFGNSRLMPDSIDKLPVESSCAWLAWTLPAPPLALPQTRRPRRQQPRPPRTRPPRARQARSRERSISGGEGGTPAGRCGSSAGRREDWREVCQGFL